MAVRAVFTDGMLSTIGKGLRLKLMTSKFTLAYVAVLVAFAFLGSNISRLYYIWALCIVVPAAILLFVPDFVGRQYVAEAIVKKDLMSIKQHYMTSPRSHFWVAVTGQDKVKGCVAVEEVSDGNIDGWVAGEDAELRRMSVDRACRGAGVSRKLFEQLRTFCIEKGFKRVVLTTSEFQHDACKIYPKVK